MSSKSLRVIFCASLCLLSNISSNSMIVNRAGCVGFDNSLKKLETTSTTDPNSLKALSCSTNPCLLDLVDSLNNKSAFLIDLNKYEESIKYSEKALDIDPISLNALIN